MDDSYLLISPCRNEAEFMIRTLESVVNQSVIPAKWIIVDDGSTDATPDILQRYSDQYDFIQIVTRDNRGHRSVGPGVIEAFYAGLEVVDLNSYQFVCKLDLDLELPVSYFQLLMQRMNNNPRIGTCSGKPYIQRGKSLVSEKRGDEMSVGMTKFYRTSCFQQIGGFVSEVMWDAIDCHRCRQLGWIACSWDDPELRFVHLRIMGSSQDSVYRGRMRHGFGQYFMGTGLLYMFATSVYRMLHPPYIFGGMAMFWGYLESLIKQVPKYRDKQLRKFIRSYQWKCLLLGKSRATALLDNQQAAVWNQQARYGNDLRAS
jgi:glycosyltransferase involved in cell wall biosynthesis